MEKTNTSKSPLLKPVIERDYTKGININTDNTISQGTASSQSSPAPTPEAAAKTGTGGSSAPPTGQKYNMQPPTPPQSPIADDTKEFSFDEIPEGANDINADDSLGGINISSASAKTFANFAGDAIQMYLPKLTYGYSKIDIDNVIVNIEKGVLTTNWLEAFEHLNENTEKALAISDDAIKMWKKAFKDYLEANNVAFANPTTALVLATIVLISDQAVRAYQIKKSNEEFMRQALEKSNSEVFKKQTSKPEPDAKVAA